MTSSNPLPKRDLPAAPATLDIVTTGIPIPPIDRIKLFDDVQWEEFVLEWGESLDSEYARVERCGGAGDMGRDVIGFVDADSSDVWDNFQCKHYAKALTPTQVWVEFGKLMYYAQKGEYTYPRSYQFIAPRGVGTKLGKFLRNGDLLRQELKNNWDMYCREGITDTEKVELKGELLKYVEEADFSIFGYTTPLQIIKQHEKTNWFVYRFGGGLPARPIKVPTPPSRPDPSEAVYLGKLMDAYSDHLGSTCDSTTLEGNGDLSGHYRDSRIEFYSAESLRNFSRDPLPVGSFEELQGEVHDGIRDEIRRDHANGYERLMSVVRVARLLQLTSHALVCRLTTRDRGGICHQLANELDEVKWVKDA